MPALEQHGEAGGPNTVPTEDALSIPAPHIWPHTSQGTAGPLRPRGSATSHRPGRISVKANLDSPPFSLSLSLLLAFPSPPYLHTTTSFPPVLPALTAAPPHAAPEQLARRPVVCSLQHPSPLRHADSFRSSPLSPIEIQKAPSFPSHPSFPSPLPLVRPTQPSVFNHFSPSFLPLSSFFFKFFF